MRIRTFLAALSLAAFVGLGLNPAAAKAEQIRLSDGRFLQGDVEEVKEDGFTFRLTDSGGKVFLRWNQVDANLKQRLKNEKDPDEGLNLDVTVDGARLELIDGSVLEGKVTRSGNTYTVVNRDRPRGIEVQQEDVVEEGVIEWGLVMAGAMFVVLPVLLVFLYAQRYIVEGIAAGAVKG